MKPYADLKVTCRFASPVLGQKAFLKDAEPKLVWTLARLAAFGSGRRTPPNAVPRRSTRNIWYVTNWWQIDGMNAVTLALYRAQMRSSRDSGAIMTLVIRQHDFGQRRHI